MQDNKRVAVLVGVICLALFVFCLVERQVLRALGGGRGVQLHLLDLLGLEPIRPRWPET
ncbi:hypothetical protein [Streptomyces mirabilis]|uniref:hypothetical protein n=1 Tax=Streptomyces mirabilis TaxID=68239 RepID=UPI0036CE8AD3